MGLSYNSNWPSTIQLQNPDMGNSFVSELAPHELFTFHDNFSLYDTCVDPLFFDPPPTPLPYYDEQSLCFNSQNNHLPPLPEFFPGQHYLLLDSTSDSFGQQQQYSCPKRQKTCHQEYLGGISDNGTSNFLPTMDPSEACWLPELPPEMLIPPLLDHSEVQTAFEINPPLPNLPEVYGHSVHHADTTTSTSTSATTSSSVDVNAKTKANGGSLSPQSIAARLRRKKISEKTGELGKLIPGGHKMNTAEMFQAASKYIKFLQAQLGVLQTMPSLQENEGDFDGEEFGGLVTSPLVQEKMYMAEKCLVPTKLIEMSLANDHLQLQSKPQLLKDINQFITKTDQ